MTRTVNGIEFPHVEPVLLQTTLNLCRAQRACDDAEAIAKKLGVGPDEPVNLLDVLRVSSVENCLWSLCAVLPAQEVDRDRVARLMAAEFAAGVLPIFEAKCPDDKRPRLAIEAARDFALGKIDAAALASARAAGWASARAAARAAEGAAALAAREATWAAGWAAEGAAALAAREATWAAAWSAESGVAWAATLGVTEDAQRAIITRYLKA